MTMLKCTLCGVEVSAEEYAKHIQAQHSSPPEAPSTTSSKEPSNEWSGSTDEIILPSLASGFWTVGMKVIGKLDGYREIQFRDNAGATRVGISYRLILESAVVVAGELEAVVELPPLTGVIAALKALKMKGYSPEKGDTWAVKCTEIRKSNRPGFSDSPNFIINATREKF